MFRFVVLAAFISLASAAPAADFVATLPGYGKPPTAQYSGFLNASAAEPGTMLHYWWASAAVADPASAPVVLWFNGGPGSSSVLGMLQEQGPLIIDRNGSLMENPYAWTKFVNFFVLESPAGVGYSYCAAMLNGGPCANTDITTAKAAHAALQDLFTTKFPELRSNDFFITGESYAGVYSPTLADQIVQGNEAGGPRINLVGMAVGDPCTDTQAQSQSMDMLWYAHKYGMVPDSEYRFLVDTCGYTHPSHIAAGKWSVAAEGGAVVAEHRQRLLAASAPANCTVAYRKFLLGSSKGISQSWDNAYINELSFYSPAGPYRFDLPGTFNYNTAVWMNRADVRVALHVSNGGKFPQWPGPAPGWSYTSSYDACNNAAPPGTRSMVDFYRALAPKLSGKIVVYNGDTDPCVSYEGTRLAIERVGFDVVQPYRPWFFNSSAASTQVLDRKDILWGGSLSAVDAGAQYGGEIVDYEHGLSFATVHGSGHMVPTFRPQAALQLIEHVVHNTPFAPQVLADGKLAAMTDGEFDAFLDKWVMSAKSAGYVSADVSESRVHGSNLVNALV